MSGSGWILGWRGLLLVPGMQYPSQETWVSGYYFTKAIYIPDGWGEEDQQTSLPRRDTKRLLHEEEGLGDTSRPGLPERGVNRHDVSRGRTCSPRGGPYRTAPSRGWARKDLSERGTIDPLHQEGGGGMNKSKIRQSYIKKCAKGRVVQNRLLGCANASYYFVFTI